MPDTFSFTLSEGKMYEYKILWGNEAEVENYLHILTGKSVFILPVVHYEELQPDQKPSFIALIEWESEENAVKALTKSSIKRQESFFTHFVKEQ